MSPTPLVLPIAIALASSSVFATITVRNTPGLTVHPTAAAPTAILPFDLDGDGLPDFSLRAQLDGPVTGIASESSGATILIYTPITLDNGGYASRFLDGQVIGGDSNATLTVIMGYFADDPAGNPYRAAWGFPGLTRGYAGLLIAHNGVTNYGWADVTSVFDPATLEVTTSITRIAYESDQGVPITAGAVPAPGPVLLPVIAAAAAAYRRRRC